MALIGFPAAIRINSNPLNPRLGVIETIDIGIDSPANYGINPPFEFCRVSHNLISDYQLTEQVGVNTTRKRAVKGLGVRLRWQIELSAYPVKKSQWTQAQAHNATSAYDAKIQALINALAVGASGFNDGVSRYLWFTPNYQWGDPGEQWFRVLPEGNPDLSLPGKTYSSVYKINLLTAKNYKSITWQYWRRGFRAAATGTVSTIAATTAVTGTGTNFLRDFIPGDRLLTAAGALLGIVASVTSATVMDLEAPGAAATYAGAAITLQRSLVTQAVPVYNAVEFAPSQGWGLSPWGDNWNN